MPRFLPSGLVLGAMVLVACARDEPRSPRGWNAPTAPTSLAGSLRDLAPGWSPLAIGFPPRDEVLEFRRDALESKYRALGRFPQPSFVDTEGTVWTIEYLRYRVNGCTHLDAMDRAFAQLRGGAPAPVCADLTSPLFPSAPEGLDFRQRLEAIFRDELRRAPSMTSVDMAGEVGWTQEYLKHRIANCSRVQASANVLAQIDGRTPPSQCQSTSCEYSLPDVPFTVGTDAMFLTIPVVAQAGCSWTAVSDQSWLPVHAAGVGSGGFTVQVGINRGPARTGRIGVENAVATVSQAGFTTPAVCDYTLARTSQDVSDAGGAFELRIVTQPGCVWSASSSGSWIEIVGVRGASESGMVGFTVSANIGAPRSAAVRIATPTAMHDLVVVQQGSARPLVASFVVSPSDRCTIDQAGRTRCTFDARVSAPASAITAYEWLIGDLAFTGAVVVNPELGTSVGVSLTHEREVRLTIRDGLGAEASITRPITFQQLLVPVVPVFPACDFEVSPAAQSVPAVGGAFEFMVRAVSTGLRDCDWYPSVPPAMASWIAIEGPARFIGSAVVRYTVAPNSGQARTDVVRVFYREGLIDFTVTQAAR